MTSADARLAGTHSTPSRGLDLIATGGALTTALVGLFILCQIVALVWPAAGLAHGWIRLFASEPANVLRTFVEGVLGSVAGAWVAALLFVPVYNRLLHR
jgi:hypothetical protein